MPSYGSRAVTPTTNQPGLLDYISQGWDSLLDTGSPFLSPNHPAAIASRNIDWDNPDPEYWQSPEVNEQIDVIGSSVGVDPSGFGGGLLGTLKRGAGKTTLSGKSFEGRVGERDHLTRTETGTLDPHSISHLQGKRGEVRGEHRNKTGEDWEKFKADIQKNGVKEPILITKDHNENAVIIEGNHRLDAALEVGLEDIPVEINYFGKAEDQGPAFLNSPTYIETSKSIFQKPKSSSPVVPVTEVPKYIDDIPDLTPADLKDLKVFPIHADLTDGGTVYTGIDSSKLDQGVGLYGGKKFPNLESSRDANVVWAVQGAQGKILRNLDEADHAVVVSMGHDAHRGNTTFADSTLNTMDAYVRDGRIGKRNLKRLDKLVRQTTPKMKNSVKQALENFPGFGAPGYQKYLENLSFDARARIVQQLASSQGQSLGAPNITKISRKLEDPSTYGTNLGDAMILIKLDKGPDNLVELGVHPGTTKHPSYKYGVKGEVVGKFPAPTSYESVFSDFSKAKREGGAEIHNILRASDLGPPVETLTKEKIKNIQFTPLQHIQSPRQAQLALEAAKGNWRTTLMPVGRGGASPTDFINAIRNSDASATLTEYSLNELKQGIKSGSFNVYQLGGKDTQVFFGIKRTNYADEYGFNHPDLGPGERAVVGVVNNEPGAKGVAAPGVMGKAIEEGATALDAYAVPSQKYPRGFLPKVYNDYGFVELGRVPFDEKYVRNPKFGGSETKYQDLLEYWRSTGWDESLGMPELVIMKWKGDNAIRSKAVRHINENGSLNPGGQITGLSEAAEKYSGQPTGSVDAGPPGTGPVNNPGRTGGGIRDSNALYSGDRFRNVLSELTLLSHNPQSAVHLQNLGLTPQSLLY